MGKAANLLGQEQEDGYGDGDGGGRESSSSSSTDSINYNQIVCSSASSSSLSTDLRLGLTISSSDHFLPSTSSSSRKNYNDWPPIKPQMRSAVMEAGKSNGCERKTNVDCDDNEEENSSLFVKVYMEGIPIGRKLDLMNHHGYHTLVAALSHMFKTPILCPGVSYEHISESDHILTYEDNDGDWMLVGDVPWEMFLSTVKYL